MAVFTNRATLSYNGNSINSNTVTGNILEVLSVTKSAVSDIYSPNDDITYVISITNSGTAAVNDVTVSDNLGAYQTGSVTVVPLEYISGTIKYYQNGILLPSPTVTAGNSLTVSGLSIPARGNAMLIYEVKTNEFASFAQGAAITNEVTLTGTGLANAVTAEETVTAKEGALLSIIKGLSPINVTENSTLTYTFTIQNTGNTAAGASDNLVITDTFDPILKNITVTADGAVLSEDNYTYSEVTGVFATVAGAVTVAAAEFTQNETTGEWTATPGVTVITVSGTV